MLDDEVASAQAAKATLYVMVGLPGSGKTTRARQLEGERQALRLTPDEWMIPLFGESDASGKRDVLEGRLVWLAARALRIGVNVILDFGVWGRDERPSRARSGRYYARGYHPQGEHRQADMNASKVKTVGRWLAFAARRTSWWVGSLVADRKSSREPPPGNWIPNSNGEGGTVISSGHPGGH